MKTALVHDWLTGMRGGEKVLEAIAGLFPEAPIYTLLHVPGSVSREIEAHPIHTSFIDRVPASHRFYRHLLPLFPSAIEDFDLSAFDLIVSSSHCVAKGVLPAPGAKHICYCHSPMRYAWDQEHAYFPRRQGLLARLRGLWLSRLRTWDAASAPRVDQFVANSRFVAERIRRYYGRTAAVLAPPVDTDFFHPAGTVAGSAGTESGSAGTESGRYALVVAALSPYKRVEQAVEACRRLELPLKVVGTGPESAMLRRFAGPGVEFLGHVSADRLRTLYQEALCLLQPGIEDFGIAPVEALASGVPVVALGLGGVLDVVEDGIHGVLYQEPRTSGLADAINRLRRLRVDRGSLRNRALTFSTMSFLARFRTLVSELMGSDALTSSDNSPEGLGRGPR